MPATLQSLTKIRSKKVDAVLTYLKDLAKQTAKLPEYFPEHLKQATEQGIQPFDNIHQQLRVVENRAELYQNAARVAETIRISGQVDPRLYSLKYEEFTEEEQEKIKTFTWNDRTLDKHKQIIVLGDPGYGKSWLLRYEARRIALKQMQVLNDHQNTLDTLILPVLIPLEALAKVMEKEQIETFGQGVIHWLTKPKSGRDDQTLLQNFLKEIIATNRCIFLLDAWDEVADSKRFELSESINDFFVDYSKVKVLLSSRIVGFTNNPLPKAKEFELLGFDDRQALTIAKVWHQNDEPTINQFQTAVQQQPAMRYLMRVPQLLNLALRTHQYYKTRGESFSDDPLKFFPSRRCELYEHCLYGLLKLWPNEKKNIVKTQNLEIDQWVSDLARAAYNLSVNKQEQFSDGELLNALELENGEYVWVLLDQLEKRGVLVRTANYDDAPLMFLHRTFQEFLTAKYLKEQIESINIATTKETWSIVEEWSWEPERDVITTLLAGQLSKPEALIKLLADKETDGYFRGRLALAAHCLVEIEEKKMMSFQELINHIIEETWRYVNQRLYFTNNDPVPGFTGVIEHMLYSLSVLGRINTKLIDSWLLDQLDENYLFLILSNIGSTRALEYIYTALNHPNKKIVLAASTSIEKSHSNSTPIHLFNHISVGTDKNLGDLSSELRHFINSFLRKICSDTLVLQLLECLGTPEESIRYCAASVLCIISSDISEPLPDKAVTNLINCLEDSNCWIQEKIKRTLCEISSKNTERLLINSFNNLSHRAKMHAINILGEIGTVISEKPLLNCCENPNENELSRGFAVSALEKIRSRNPMSQLIISQVNLDDIYRQSSYKTLDQTSNTIEFQHMIKYIDSPGLWSWVHYEEIDALYGIDALNKILTNLFLSSSSMDEGKSATETNHSIFLHPLITLNIDDGKTKEIDFKLFSRLFKNVNIRKFKK